VVSTLAALLAIRVAGPEDRIRLTSFYTESPQDIMAPMERHKRRGP